ncbi:hypothetical protein SGLAM104S_01383 [Streptomyces glaucescens]
MKDGVNGVALAVFIFFFLAVTVMGFLAARWRRADVRAVRENGVGAAAVRHRTPVRARRRTSTGLHLRAVPAAIDAAGAAVFAVRTTGLPPERTLAAPWSVSTPRRCDHPDLCAPAAPGAAWRWRGSPPGADPAVGKAVLDVMGVGGGEDPRSPRSCRLTFGVLAAYTDPGPAGPGAHRVREGHPDLHRHRRGDHLHPHQARRVRRDLRRGGRGVRRDQPGDRRAARGAGPGPGRPVDLRHAGVGPALALLDASARSPPRSPPRAAR